MHLPECHGMPKLVRSIFSLKFCVLSQSTWSAWFLSRDGLRGLLHFFSAARAPVKRSSSHLNTNHFYFAGNTHRIGLFICCARGKSLCPLQTPSPARLTRFTARCLFPMLIPLSAQPSIAIYFFYKTKRLQQNTFLLCALLRESSILKNT